MNAGEIIQGRYRLEKPLGTGGMATVWKAHDLRLERSVALKCLTAPLSEDPEYLVRFFAEAQQVARLSHPNIVRVLDFGQGEECPFLVMEYLPGGSLAELAGAPIEPGRAAELIGAAAVGAGAAHAAGMVHRDLKPGNILLSEDGEPKLADFGIAVTSAQERLTATGTAIGSPHYVSPEQASGRPIGPPSDVYSLGIVLYELLTGRRPFEHDNATALAIAHVEEQPQPPSALLPDLDPAFDDVVMTCLAKDPEQRFATGTELADALERISAGDTASTVTAAAVAAPAMAPRAAPVDVPGEDAEDRNVRRAVSLSLLVALFLGLLVFGVMALGGRDGRPVPEDKAFAEVDRDGSGKVKGARSESAKTQDAYREDQEKRSGPAATPSPAETSEERDGEKEERYTESAARGSNTEEEPVEEPEEKPSPEPTSEPTEEPTPEPTSSP